MDFQWIPVFGTPTITHLTKSQVLYLELVHTNPVLKNTVSNFTLMFDE